MDDGRPEHKRRVRYKGTHPHTYQEKYKELDPTRYAADVAHITESGKTPAGTHIPICVQEILDFLQIQPEQSGLDATLGYGGHTQKMLEQLGGKGHLTAIDADPIELEKTEARLRALGYDSSILTVRQMNFADIDRLGAEGARFDFVLADLGVSSMQIDNPARGFSFKYDGPLDLRLNPQAGVPASARLRELSQEELCDLLVENSDEPYAAEIAAAVVRENKKGAGIDTTKQLARVIETALAHVPAAERAETVKKSCQRTFQALRIDVNSEFEVLYAFLEKLPQVLNGGGRVAVLTFHSGEDRLVKQAFRHFQQEGVYADVCHEVIRPSAEECFRNPRARSTKMRWAIKAPD
jgi:16S rRNA (cytosine1402-N4)-methyltransferase